MSDVLNDFWEGPRDCTVAANIESEHFNLMAELLFNVRLLENLDILQWKRLSNKMVYLHFATNFTKPKLNLDAAVNTSPIWKRLKMISSSREVHECVFLMLHNKLPIQERLFRIHLASDPYCPCCLHAPIQDINHYFSSCERVCHYWSWIRNLCVEVLGNANVDDESLLNFHWPSSTRDRDISWLIGHYVFIVWDMLFSRKLHIIRQGEFFGYMKFKYKEAIALNKVSRFNIAL